MDENQEEGAGSSMRYWARLLIGGLCMPLLFPWLVYYLYKIRIREKIYGSRCLQDRVCLITGASSGLGEALAHVFYNAGCKVILAARREEELERVKAALLDARNDGSLHEPAILPFDLSDIKDIPSKAEKALNIHGKIDILINNGGISYRGEIKETSTDVDFRVMVVNYLGHVALTKALLPAILEAGEGTIVAISSLQGKIAIPYRSAYAASKHAMEAFFDTLRSELVGTKITVCVVSPGYIRTNLSLNAVTGDGSQYGVMDATTASGMLPRDVARSILSAVMAGDQEVILSPLLHKLVILLRVLCPTLYFQIMKNRAARIRNQAVIEGKR